MTRKKAPNASPVHSSAAEYLTFVAGSGTGSVEAVCADENVWPSQKMMAQFYDVDIRTINHHLKTIFTGSELEEDAVIQHFRIAAADGKTYETKHYGLSAIIAAGYRVISERAVQFRKWATRVVEEFAVKGFAMDDERLKRGGSVAPRCGEGTADGFRRSLEGVSSRVLAMGSRTAEAWPSGSQAPPLFEVGFSRPR